ncbi:hypothetical protein BC834DRAFT_1046018 [Gloeopeniophorella convolvens]|nr:hypothetical protein BC834DRAFT_1046018 [Gloeopeniophorella convolvens]
MSEGNPYTLYDIPANSAKHLAWSPSTWKARLALNYKCIPYKTEWVEFPDIAPLAERIGAPHTSVGSDGTLKYTAPIVRNVRTGSTVSDSYKIAQALERDHPEPPLFPPGRDDAIEAVERAFSTDMALPSLGLLAARTHNQLNDASKPYFRRTREELLGAPIGQFDTPEQWIVVRDTLAPIAAAADARGESDTFLVGKTETYADIIAAAWLGWVRRMCGAGTQEWAEVEKWHGGRWGRLVRAFKKWEYVDDPSQPDEAV